MAKNKTQKLTKNQLKKLKGGLIACTKTECIGDTCGQHLERSLDHCAGSEVNTAGLTSGPSTKPKAKK